MSHNVPEGVAYGTVHGEFMSFAADRAGTAAGPDGVPDKIPMEGYVVITPKVETVRWPSLVPPITAVIQDVRCPLIEGRLYPPGTTPESAASVTPGVVLVATEQPEALPSTVQYTLTFDLRGIKRQPPAVTFNVPASGVVDLTTVMPATPDPGTVVVVSTESRERAELAADTATSKASEAASSATAAAGSATAAASSASAASTSATAAASSATAAAGSAGSINWAGLPGKPAVIAAGATAAEARTAIGAAEQQATGWTAITVLPAQATGEVVVSKVGDAVLVSGELTAVAAWGSGWVVANNIPAAYRPPVTRSFMVGNYRFNITSAGGLMCMSTIAKDTTVYISGLIRL